MSRYRPITKLPSEYAQTLALIRKYRGQRLLKKGKSVTEWSQIQPIIKTAWYICQQYIKGRVGVRRLGRAYDIAVHQRERHFTSLPHPYSVRAHTLCVLLVGLIEYLEKQKQVPLSWWELRQLEKVKRKKKSA